MSKLELNMTLFTLAFIPILLNLMYLTIPIPETSYCYQTGSQGYEYWTFNGVDVYDGTNHVFIWEFKEQCEQYKGSVKLVYEVNGVKYPHE